METIIVMIIVSASTIFAIRYLYKIFTFKDKNKCGGCFGNCSACPYLNERLKEEEK